MARKKRVKHKTHKVAKRTSHRNLKRKFKSLDPKNKIKLVVNNLLFFVALCLVSLVLYRFVKNIILMNLFSVMAMIFGFVAVAFLIALLVLLIRRMMKK
jgi:hypothetical protein